jgi:hypothetical protein
VTSKTDFTDDEWARLKRAPFIAGMAISLADPGGPIEAFKETAAALKTVVGATDSSTRGTLVAAIAGEVAGDAQQHHNPLGDFKPAKGTAGGTQILDELREVNRIVTDKASPEDAAAVRAWLLDAARNAADAAKEGGFMGFHAVRVSEGEQRMLDQLGEVLST